MSVWADHDVETKIVEVLRDVRIHDYYDQHVFGRPFMSAYQLAIALDARFPEVRQALDCPIGGSGIGQRDSLAQYLGRELSRRIGQGEGLPIEGGFVSNMNVESIRYRSHDGTEIVSSLTGTPYDLSMFRLNPAGG